MAFLNSKWDLCQAPGIEYKCLRSIYRGSHGAKGQRCSFLEDQPVTGIVWALVSFHKQCVSLCERNQTGSEEIK